MAAELSKVICNSIQRNEHETTLVLTATVAPGAEYASAETTLVSFICDGVNAPVVSPVTNGVAQATVVLPEDQVPFVGEDLNFIAKLQLSGHEVSGKVTTPPANGGVDHGSTETSRRHYANWKFKYGADRHVFETTHANNSRALGIYALVMYWAILIGGAQFIAKPFWLVQGLFFIITGFVAVMCYIHVLHVRYTGHWKEWSALHMGLNLVAPLACWLWQVVPNK